MSRDPQLHVRLNDPSAAMHDAIVSDDTEAIKALLARDANLALAPVGDYDDALFARAVDGNTRQEEHSQWLALSRAVHDDAEGAIEQHLGSHPECDVNAQDASGETALMRAARFACFNAGRQLLDAGANPSLSNSEGETAVSLFLSHAHQSSLMRRAPEESIQFIDVLLSASARFDAARGASADAPSAANFERHCEETLRFALWLGEPRLVEAVAPRCAPATRDALATELSVGNGLSSGYRASEGGGSLAAADALLPHLRAGAESLLRARRGYEADTWRSDSMFEAAHKGDEQTVEELLADGCPANLAKRDDRRGVRTPFLEAIQARRFDAARALLRGGADPSFGVEPLDYLICKQRGAMDLAGAVARVLPAAQIEASLRETIDRQFANTSCAGLSWGQQVEGLLSLLPESDARNAFEDKAIEIARAAFPGAPLAQRLPIAAARLERKQLQAELLAVADAAVAAPDEPCATARIGDRPSHQRDQALAFLAACNSAPANDRGDTGLMIAARDHGPGLVEALVPLSNPLALNDAGESAFAVAVKAKKFDCADALAPHSNPVEVARAFERSGAGKMPQWAARLEGEAGAKEARVATAVSDRAVAAERTAHAVATVPDETPQAAPAKPRAMRL
ncbi:hypothetical protein BX589_10193 [Paraburkholderia fungorum]|jgi:ankyrin repeat protein|uniref:ankyrin repeat domain-containing protein n=1 Tax=Paraburkholderia fungorum TaxID=134537 RepID=UPI000D05C133|nr:ankyrin repeat domain-containing protein [Paraburkholderia fungorum]PRZ56443.1 hypothetical protein BX589_10193 [Paraburkholderia fungorum]